MDNCLPMQECKATCTHPPHAQMQRYGGHPCNPGMQSSEEPPLSKDASGQAPPPLQCKDAERWGLLHARMPPTRKGCKALEDPNKKAAKRRGCSAMPRDRVSPPPNSHVPASPPPAHLRRVFSGGWSFGGGPAGRCRAAASAARLCAPLRASPRRSAVRARRMCSLRHRLRPAPPRSARSAPVRGVGTAPRTATDCADPSSLLYNFGGFLVIFLINNQFSILLQPGATACKGLISSLEGAGSMAMGLEV